MARLEGLPPGNYRVLPMQREGIFGLLTFTPANPPGQDITLSPGETVFVEL